MNPRLQGYVPLVNFIAEVVGPNCEVVLHDLSDLEHSVVAISDNRLTDRQIGSSITDFALRVLQNRCDREQDYVTNYAGQPRDERRTFRSSTLFIKDEAGNTVGMLCVNVDITDLRAAREAMDKFLLQDRMFFLDERQKAHETYAESVGDLLENLIRETRAQFSAPPESLGVAEKRRFVALLSQKGGFLLKGAVSRAASQTTLPITPTASMLIPVLVEPMFTDEQTNSVCASARGMDSISSLSPAANPLCTKAE